MRLSFVLLLLALLGASCNRPQAVKTTASAHSAPSKKLIQATWRTLYQFEKNTPMVPLLGHFDKNTNDQQLVLIWEKGIELFTATGAHNTLPSDYDVILMVSAVAWDYDRDGVDEIVTPPTNNWNSRNSQLKICNLQGKQLKLCDIPKGGRDFLTGDLDGDGFAELVTASGMNMQAATATVFGDHAQQLGEIKLLGHEMNPTLADLDGDGEDELITYAVRDGSSDSRSYALSKDPRDLNIKWPWPSLGQPSAMQPFSSNDRDDMLAGTCFWNSTQQKLVKLNPELHGSTADPVAVFQPTGSNERLLAVKRFDTGKIDTIIFYNTDGQSVGTSTLPANIGPLITLIARGRDYLVALTDNELCICP